MHLGPVKQEVIEKADLERLQKAAEASSKAMHETQEALHAALILRDEQQQLLQKLQAALNNKQEDYNFADQAAAQAQRVAVDAATIAQQDTQAYQAALQQSLEAYNRPLSQKIMEKTGINRALGVVSSWTPALTFSRLSLPSLSSFTHCKSNRRKRPLENGENAPVSKRQEMDLQNLPPLVDAPQGVMVSFVVPNTDTSTRNFGFNGR